MVALLVIAAVAAASGQSTVEACQARVLPVGVSIDETVGGERRTFLGLLAFFGASVEAVGSASLPLVVADDKSACKPIAEVKGKAVLVWRGECSFIEKAAAAQAAGAAAVIVVTDETELSPMSCAGNQSITIPVMQVLSEDGAQLAADAAKGESDTR